MLLEGKQVIDYSDLAEAHLNVEVKNKVAVVTLNRPDRLNAMGDGLHQAIEEFLHRVNFDSQVNAAVITGAGRAFCAGGDVKSMGARATGETPKFDPTHLLRNARYLVQRFINCEVPLIAAINGPAVGLGATIALLCDVTFMAEGARIGDTHVKVGITAGDGGSFIWPYLIGPHRAKDLLMTGRLIYGKEAYEMGLVNYVYPDDQMLDKAMEYAQEIAEGAPAAIRFTKMSVNRHLWDGLSRVMEFSLLSEQVTMLTDDHKEATQAFSEKRKPKFTGH